MPVFKHSTEVVFYRGKVNGAEFFAPICEPELVCEELRTAIVHVTVASGKKWPRSHGLQIITFVLLSSGTWSMLGGIRPTMHETAAIHDGTWLPKVDHECKDTWSTTAVRQ